MAMRKEVSSSKKVRTRKKTRKLHRYTPEQEEWILKHYPDFRGLHGEVEKLRRSFNRTFGTRVSIHPFSQKCGSLHRKFRKLKLGSESEKVIKPEVSEPLINIQKVKGLQENTLFEVKVNNTKVWRGNDKPVIEVVKTTTTVI